MCKYLIEEVKKMESNTSKSCPLTERQAMNINRNKQIQEVACKPKETFYSEKLVKQLSMLSTEVAEFLSLEKLKTCLDLVMNSLLCLVLILVGRLDKTVFTDAFPHQLFSYSVRHNEHLMDTN